MYWRIHFTVGPTRIFIENIYIYAHFEIDRIWSYACTHSEIMDSAMQCVLLYTTSGWLLISMRCNKKKNESHKDRYCTDFNHIYLLIKLFKSHQYGFKVWNNEAIQWVHESMFTITYQYNIRECRMYPNKNIELYVYIPH